MRLLDTPLRPTHQRYRSLIKLRTNNNTLVDRRYLSRQAIPFQNSPTQLLPHRRTSKMYNMHLKPSNRNEPNTTLFIYDHYSDCGLFSTPPIYTSLLRLPRHQPLVSSNPTSHIVEDTLSPFDTTPNPRTSSSSFDIRILYSFLPIISYCYIMRYICTITIV